MNAAPLRIFISSTTVDLGECRRKVADAVLRLGQMPITMETFGASSSSAQTVSVERVRECEVVVGLIGLRYGHVPAGYTKSVTEMEYDAATSAQKIVLMYVPATAFAGAASASPDSQQQQFIARIQRESHLCATYRDPADLPAIVSTDLHRVLTGGAPGIIAYRKGLRELQSGNYPSALYDLSWAVHLLPDDGAPAFLLALASLHGQRPRRVSLEEIKRVAGWLEVASRLSPGRAVFAFRGAVELDYYVKNGFGASHEDTARGLWRQALQFDPDPYQFDLIKWLQPDFAADYLEPFM